MNKWIIGIVAVLLFAAPAMSVTITTTLEDSGDLCKVYIRYSAGAEEDIRAFALDIEADDANIVEVNDLNADYWVYPGSIYIVAGEVNQVGTPDANGTDFPPPGTLPGVGTSGVTIEMGSLYAAEDPEHPDAPPKTGLLCTIKVDGNCTVTVGENEARGGVVQEDAESADVTLPPPLPVECSGGCFPTGPEYAKQNTDYQLYVANGYDPTCWCSNYGAESYTGNQCYGDGAGDVHKKGYIVYTNDLLRLSSSWKAQMGDANLDPCADFAHDVHKKGYRVYTTDLGILSSNWKATVLPGDCPKTDAEMGL